MSDITFEKTQERNIPKLQNDDFRFFFDMAESQVAGDLCSILTSDGVPFPCGKNSFPVTIQPCRLLHVFYIHNQSYKNVTIDFQGLPWLRICCSQHFSQIIKVGAK